MQPIPGETYDQYLRRATDSGEIPYLMSELRDMGWEELANGELWLPSLTGEPAPPGAETGEPPSGEDDTGGVGAGQSGPVTVHWWVWCYDPAQGQWVGPYTQMEDFDWSDGIAYIVAQVDALSQAFCAGAMAQTSPKAPRSGESTDYDWAIQSPLGLQFSRGI